MILFMTVFTNGNLLKEKYGYFGSDLFAGRCYGKGLETLAETRVAWLDFILGY